VIRHATQAEAIDVAALRSIVSGRAATFVPGRVKILAEGQRSAELTNSREAGSWLVASPLSWFASPFWTLFVVHPMYSRYGDRAAASIGLFHSIGLLVAQFLVFVYARRHRDRGSPSPGAPRLGYGVCNMGIAAVASGSAAVMAYLAQWNKSAEFVAVALLTPTCLLLLWINIVVAVRRSHDLGRSAWFVPLALIPSSERFG